MSKIVILYHLKYNIYHFFQVPVYHANLVYSNHWCDLLNYIYFYIIMMNKTQKHKCYNAVIFVVYKPWNLTLSSQKASFLIKPCINYACVCGSGCAVFMNISLNEGSMCVTAMLRGSLYVWTLWRSSLYGYMNLRNQPVRWCNFLLFNNVTILCYCLSKWLT